MKMEWGFWVYGCVLLIRLGHTYRLAMLWLGFGRQSSEEQWLEERKIQ